MLDSYKTNSKTNKPLHFCAHTALKKAVCFLFTILISFTMLSSCRPHNASGLSVYILAIGKADCILIQTATNNVLIDTGEADDYPNIKSFLNIKNVVEIDAVILSHFDKDHIGGAANVLRDFEVKTVYQPDFSSTGADYAAYLAALDKTNLAPLALHENLSFSADGAVFTVFPPKKSHYAEKEDNNSSLVLSVSYESKQFLFCGDAMEDRLNELIDDDIGEFDFIKLPYHGNYLSNYPQFLAMTKPKSVAVTCSAKNPEDPETAALLAENDIQCFLTRLGRIEIECDKDGIRIIQR